MQIGRVTMMAVLAALIALPLAYAQLAPVLDGAEYLFTSFTPTEAVKVASLAD